MSDATEFSYGSCSVSSERDESGRVHVTVVGELDLFTATKLRRTLRQDARAFVVDLVDCEFLDSTALGMLVAARNRVGRLALIAPGVAVRRSRAMSGLDQVLPVYGSRTSIRGAADA